MILGLALAVAAAAVIPLVQITDPRSGQPFFRSRPVIVILVMTVAVLVAAAFFGVGLATRGG